MKAEFWHQKWQAGQIGFHKAEVNPALVRHLPALGLSEGVRVFLPLCGKTLDIGWLRAQGYRVAGAELSELAVRQLFDDLGETPDIVNSGALKQYRTEGIDIFVGDIFELTAQALGPVDAVYDRAALVALPAEMRPDYAQHVAAVTANAAQLLISFDYDQSVMAGPPFSVPSSEVSRLYAVTHAPVLVEQAEVEGGLKGFCPADAYIWHLQPRM